MPWRSRSFPEDVFGEEGLGGLRGARHACRELAPEAVLALEGHGSDRVFTDAVGSLRVRLTVTGPGGHSWWDRGRPSAVHELVRLLTGMIASVPAPLSVNVGLVDGGTGVNAIAARASATVEWRATDQAAALDPVKQPQVELAAGGGPAHPRALLGPDDHARGLPPVFQQVAKGYAEPQGQRPQRLDGRVAPALLQVGQRGLGHVRTGCEGSQRHPAGGAEPPQVRRDDLPDIGESLVGSLVPHASELYQQSNKMVQWAGRRGYMRFVGPG